MVKYKLWYFNVALKLTIILTYFMRIYINIHNYLINTRFVLYVHRICDIIPIVFFCYVMFSK